MKKDYLLFGASAFATFSPQTSLAGEKISRDEKPNIVLILVDDMGYSDIGCYGGEIPTPNIDRLARQGVRYTQFYNVGRSCPSRASLLTGLYPHQAGIGAMSEEPFDKTKFDKWQGDREVHGYRGSLNRNCVTIAEVLKSADYHTYMVGKWHLGMYGQEKWPLQRGFERFYGILTGACSYLKPQADRGLMLDNMPLSPPDQPYYTTDAFTDYGIQFLKDQQDDKPFFLYVSYNAPHWPLQAKDKDIKKFLGKYDSGWEEIREKRRKRMLKMGLIDANWGLAEWESRHWSELTDQERHDSSMRMSVYAAQVYAVDYNVGKLLDYLEKEGKLDNTLFVFLSDNGACAEPHIEQGSGTVGMINNPDSWQQPSYGLPWAQVSNTPYRKYKVRAYEGGIATPLIFSWKNKYMEYSKELRHNVSFLPDLMATFVDVSGATYPERFHNGNEIIPLEGKSLCLTINHPDTIIHDYMYGEHFENCYVRWHNWKAVKDQTSKKWELFNIEKDRTERFDLAGEHPEILTDLIAKWNEWAHKDYVYPKRKD